MSTSEETPPPTMAGHADPREMIVEKQFMAAMEISGSDKALLEAFNLLSSSMGMKGHFSSDVISRGMLILGVNIQGIKIDEVFLKKAQVENAEKIDREGFIRVMKNIWKGMADSMINEVEKVIDEFISNKAMLENIHTEFSNSLKDTWKRVADSIIHEVEKEIDELISGNAGQENDGIIPMKLISSMKDIWKRVTDLKIDEVKKEIDESIPNKVELPMPWQIPQWFINSVKDLWKGVVDSMISQVEKEIDVFISNKAELKNGENIRGEFITSLKDIQKRVDDSLIKEEVGSNEVMKRAYAMVLAERQKDSDASVALLLRLMPYLGGNLEVKIIDDIKDNVDHGQTNSEQSIQFISNIWKKSVEFLSKAMGGGAAQKKAAFTVLHNPLDDFVSATILKVVMLNLGGHVDFEELHRTICYVKAKCDDEQIKLQGFVEIME